MGFGVTSSAPCLAAVFGVCSFLFVTIWVAPENRARELRTRGSTVLTQDSQESQMGRMLTPSTEDQISCISRLSYFPVVGQFCVASPWRAANLGRSRLFRRPEPAESRLRGGLPGPPLPNFRGSRRK